MKLARRLWKWCGNGWIAARASFSSGNRVRNGLRLLDISLYLLWWMAMRGRVPIAKNWTRRLRLGCGRCTLYNPERGTCGTLGKGMEHPFTREWIPQAGCLCTAALKSQIPESQCWMAQITDGQIDYWKDV